MPISTKREAVATGVRFSQERVYVTLNDGREIGAPLSRFPFLEKASPRQRANWRLEPGGFAVYWPDLDDGFEIEHLLNGAF